jgi:secretion/DNA translocation related TadE-like protein
MSVHAPAGAAGGTPDQGAGSVLVLAVTAVVLLLAAAIGLLGQVEAARAAAQSGADLAALAGAARLQRSHQVEDACALAGQVADRNEVRLVACTHRGDGVVEVTVARATPVGDATASARAGPASARSS